MPFENDVENCLKILNSGGIILYPTDTIWGIGCDATDSNAVQKIFQLKNREEKKSMIILVDDKKMIYDYVSHPSEKILSYIFTAQKPTTAIFKNAINLPSNLVNADGSVAIRIAKDNFCCELIGRLKKPLVSTSGNVSGESSPKNFSEISNKIKSGVDYIVQHRQDDLSEKSPSSIIKLSEENEILFIR